MPSRGLGRSLGAGVDIDPEDLFPVGTDMAEPDLLNDYWWGGGPAPVTSVPYDWLIQPLAFRPDPPINVADITTTQGAQAHAANTSSRDEYGEYPPSTTQLDTIIDADAANYAAHLVANYTAPRQRSPTLTLDLLERTDVERRLILAREIGDRISITGAPATWPEGTTSLGVEGITHTIGLDIRTVAWNVAPVVGTVPGTPGPWFQLDASSLGSSTDLLPF